MHKLLIIFISFFFSFNVFAYPTGLLNYKLDDIFLPDNSFMGFKDGFFKKTEQYNLFIYTDSNNKIDSIAMFPRVLFSDEGKCINYIEQIYNNSKQFYKYKNTDQEFYLSPDKNYNDYLKRGDFIQPLLENKKMTPF